MPLKRQRGQRGTAGAAGSSLIEVLVAFVITAVVLLGLMRLVPGAFLQTGEARTRAFVATQMQALVVAVQANRAYWVAAGAGDQVAASGAGDHGAPSGTGDHGTEAAIIRRAIALDAAGLPPADLCEHAPCRPLQMALADVARVRDALRQRASEVRGEVACAGPAGRVSCVVRLSWQERMAAAQATRRELSRQSLP
ncbi:type IV pilus modification PilV family protein [Cupriavidus sp. Marseille-Q8015]